MLLSICKLFTLKSFSSETITFSLNVPKETNLCFFFSPHMSYDFINYSLFDIMTILFSSFTIVTFTILTLILLTISIVQDSLLSHIFFLNLYFFILFYFSISLKFPYYHAFMLYKCINFILF